MATSINTISKKNANDSPGGSRGSINSRSSTAQGISNTSSQITNSTNNNHNDAIALRFRQRKISLKQKLRIYKYLDFQKKNTQQKKNSLQDDEQEEEEEEEEEEVDYEKEENNKNKSKNRNKNEDQEYQENQEDSAIEGRDKKFASPLKSSSGNATASSNNNSNLTPVLIQSVFEPPVSLSLDQKEVLSVETGVEKHEEREEHLKQILQSTNQLHHQYIPTPDASKKWNEFSQFYQGSYTYPESYIVSSATLEDYCGIEYLMDERDCEFLENSLKNSNISEDEFEYFCQFFEETIKELQPYLSIDPSSILPFEAVQKHLSTKIEKNLSMLTSSVTSNNSSSSSTHGIDFNLKNELVKETGFSKTNYKLLWDSPISMRFFTNYSTNSNKVLNIMESYGDKIYEYWKNRKLEKNGESFHPQLRFEKNGEKNENDPYVCFRRRESRQIRKTRKMDQSNSQKLHVLLNQLKKTRELSLLISKREKINMDSLKNIEKTFNDRQALKNLKRKYSVIDTSSDDGLVDSSIVSRKKSKTVDDFEERRNIHYQKMEEQFIHENNLAPSILNLQKRKKNALSGKSKYNSVDGSKNKKRKQQSNKDSSKHNSSGGSRKQDSQVLQQQGFSKQNKQAGLNAMGSSETSATVGKGINKKDLQSKLARQGQLSAKGKNMNPNSEQQSNIYIKLNNSNIPDIDLPNVSKFLTNKENSSRKYLQDAINKKIAEDQEGNFFNLGDNTLNPTIDVNLPTYLADPSNALNSSISSSSFEFIKSYYNPFIDKTSLSNYTTSSGMNMKNNSYRDSGFGMNNTQNNFQNQGSNTKEVIDNQTLQKNVVGIKHNGDKLNFHNAGNESKLLDILQPEVYDLFDNGNDQHHQNEVHTKELSFQLRSRTGRFGYRYIDKRYNSNHQVHKDKVDVLNDFFDFDLMEKQETPNVTDYNNTENEQSAPESVNVYDSELDKYVRLQDRWKYDTDHNLYGKSLMEEPAQLNKISKDTQVIRFGTMLWAKAYDQSRESLLRYRKDFYNKVTKFKQQQAHKQKILQHQFMQQQQNFQQQQHVLSQQNSQRKDGSGNTITKGTRKAGPRKQGTPRTKQLKNSTNSPKVVGNPKKTVNNTSTPAPTESTKTPVKAESKNTPNKTTLNSTPNAGVAVNNPPPSTSTTVAGSPSSENTLPKTNSVH